MALRVDPLTGGPSVPNSWARALTFNGVNGLQVSILDSNGVTLQTFTINLPTFSIHAPTINGECDHADRSTPSTSNADWTNNATSALSPLMLYVSWNRVLASQKSRAALIQAGDTSRSVEANSDLRVISG